MPVADGTTDAIIGKGCVIGFGTARAGPFTDFVELKDLIPPVGKVPKVEATHHLSPSNTAEFLSAVWKEYDEATFVLNFKKTRYTEVNNILGSSKFFKITLPDSSYFTWPGHVSEVGPATPLKDVMLINCKISVNGAVLYTE